MTVFSVHFYFPDICSALFFAYRDSDRRDDRKSAPDRYSDRDRERDSGGGRERSDRGGRERSRDRDR